MKLSPCKNCEMRNIRCHIDCKDYLDWHKEHEQYKADKKAFDERMKWMPK